MRQVVTSGDEPARTTTARTSPKRDRHPEGSWTDIPLTTPSVPRRIAVVGAGRLGPALAAATVARRAAVTAATPEHLALWDALAAATGELAGVPAGTPPGGPGGSLPAPRTPSLAGAAR